MIKTILYAILIFLGIWIIVPWIMMGLKMYFEWVVEIWEKIEGYFIEKHNERVSKK